MTSSKERPYPTQKLAVVIAVLDPMQVEVIVTRTGLLQFPASVSYRTVNRVKLRLPFSFFFSFLTCHWASSGGPFFYVIESRYLDHCNSQQVFLCNELVVGLKRRLLRCRQKIIIFFNKNIGSSFGGRKMERPHRAKTLSPLRAS